MENQEKKWYALKVFYNKVFELESKLKVHSDETYVPVKVVEKMVKGKRTYIQKPAISSLLFLSATHEQVENLLPMIEGKALFYRDKGCKHPTAIPDREMMMFKKVTSGHSDGLEYFDGNVAKYCTGQRVRVIDGFFQGCEGYIHRIKGDRRLIVAVEGLVAVATTHIPSAFLEPVQ